VLWREQSDGAGTGSSGGEEGFFLRSHGDRRLVELTDTRLVCVLLGVEGLSCFIPGPAVGMDGNPACIAGNGRQ
jgi:hypothetical protein